jgi:hypothetical protein
MPVAAPGISLKLSIASLYGPNTTPEHMFWNVQDDKQSVKLLASYALTLLGLINAAAAAPAVYENSPGPNRAAFAVSAGAEASALPLSAVAAAVAAVLPAPLLSGFVPTLATT